jgi:hypothetical protein
MRTHDTDRALAAANPIGDDMLARLDLGALEADLLADIDGGGSASAQLVPPRVRPRRGRLAVGFATVAIAAAVAVVLILAGGGAEKSSRAYGASLVRFAEASPLLLLEGPGWRVQNVDEHREREGIAGSMEFVTGKPIPYETIRQRGSARRPTESGMFPPAVRQRRVNLEWRHESLLDQISYLNGLPHPHGRKALWLPVLDTKAYVDTRAEFYANQGGPGNRRMVAVWSEDGFTLTLQAAVPSLTAFEERLEWLTKVDQGTWLEAMPAKVVAASNHAKVVREVLKGVPTPKTFTPARVPDEGLNTNRYQVGAQATGAVACLWFRQWGEAVRTGDVAAREEAVKAMATAKHWPILREMTKDGDWSYVLWEDAKWMPLGYFPFHGHKRDLLAHAEGLGCARQGIPLTPKKMKIARERGGPPPPP